MTDGEVHEDQITFLFNDGVQWHRRHWRAHKIVMWELRNLTYRVLPDRTLCTPTPIAQRDCWPIRFGVGDTLYVGPLVAIKQVY